MFFQIVNIWFIKFVILSKIILAYCELTLAQPVKINLNKKLDAKQKTSQIFNIDSKGFGKTENENLPIWEIRLTSLPVPASLPMVGRLAGTG